MKKSILIVGPTGVGKTRLSVELAKSLNTEIISADSMQIYKGMNIGTAKVTEIEKRGIPHHMIDIVSPDEEFSVSDYKDMTENLIESINYKGCIPIIVGGTGLYINSITYDLNFAEIPKNNLIREQIEAQIKLYGEEFILNKLKDIDRETYNSIDKKNIRRVIRAVEVFESTGKPYSSFGNGFRNKRSDMVFYIIGLTDDRSVLYERINNRVDQMIDNGLIEEVKSLMHKYGTNHQSFKAIGYKEVVDFINGITVKDEMINILKQNSRRYAKRQLTWFRRDERIIWYNLSDYESFEKIVDSCRKDVSRFNER